MSNTWTHLWKIVEQGFHPVDPDNLTPREDINSQLNATTLHKIQSEATDEYLPHIQMCKTAKDAWQKLDTLFLGNKTSNNPSMKPPWTKPKSLWCTMMSLPKTHSSCRDIDGVWRQASGWCLDQEEVSQGHHPIQEIFGHHYSVKGELHLHGLEHCSQWVRLHWNNQQECR